MQAIKKQIVTDEAFNPVAVIIDYQDWQRIEAILKRAEQENLLEEEVDNSEVLMSYAGRIPLTVDPLDYQRAVRDEWR
jgi:hypothetical protein